MFKTSRQSQNIEDRRTGRVSTPGDAAPVAAADVRIRNAATATNAPRNPFGKMLSGLDRQGRVDAYANRKRIGLKFRGPLTGRTRWNEN